MPSTLEHPGKMARAVQLQSKITELQSELQALRGTTVPGILLPEIHDEENGRIDAQKVAVFMGIPLKHLAEGLGLSYKAVHRNPSASAFQEALQPVKQSLEVLHGFFGPPEAIRAWLNTPHPLLDGETSLATILDGKAYAIARLLVNAWYGIPA